MSLPVVIIPVRNRRELTLACLHRLSSNGDLRTHEVLVIDDGSTDGTAEAVARNHPEVLLRRGGGDLHWGGAIAAGMREALREGPRPVFWLNDDCLPQAGTLDALGSSIRADPGCIMVPRCVDAVTRAPWPNGFIGRHRVAGHPGRTSHLDGASGYCAGIGTMVSAALGPVDEVKFPHHYADSAYTLRATRAGFRVILAGDAEVELVRPGRAVHRIAERIEPRTGLLGNAGRVFQATNSPFRLRTLFAFQCLKYGVPAGTLLACVKVAVWASEFATAHLRRQAAPPAALGSGK